MPRLAALLTVFLLALAGAAVCEAPAAAQGFGDYGRLFALPGSGGEDMDETREAEDPPRQSRPVGEFSPAAEPDLEDYARVAETYDPGGVGSALAAIDTFRARLARLLLAAPAALEDLAVTLEVASPTGRPEYFLGVALFALLLLAVGQAVARLAGAYLFRPFFVGMQRPHPEGYAEKLPVLAVRLGLTLVGSALALGTAAAIGLVFHEGHEPTLTTAAAILLGWGAITVIDTLWRLVLCPYLPAYRIPAIPDAAARQLYRWATAISALAVMGLAGTLWLRLAGVPRETHAITSLALTAGLLVLLLVAIRANAAAVGEAIAAGRARAAQSWLTRAAGALWAPVAVIYLLAVAGKLTHDLVMGVDTGIEQLVVPYLVLMGGLVVHGCAAWAIERVFQRRRLVARANAEAARRRAAAEAAQAADAAGTGSHDAEADEEGGPGPPAPLDEAPSEATTPPPPPRGMRSFEDLALRVASLLALGTSAWILLYAWGGPDVFGESMVIGIAEDVIDILLVGYVAFHAVRIWMDQKIAEEVGDVSLPEPGEGEGGGAGASRLATLLPLVRNFILTIMAVAIALVVASELGLNVAPLFAGAGIVGLAIGFGSQTLVRDILSGAFFLMDDAFRRGEYIDAGDVKGTVEKISLRSFQLRHHLGMLHTIPFGELKFLTNYSRDWVMMKLPLRLTYDTDVERVRKLVKKLGQQLLEDPEIGDKFLQPLKSQGVIQMDDSAMIVRVKFMTRPGEQWVIRKRVYQEIRELFEREGIKFAHREVTVRIPDLDRGRPLGPEETEAVAGAARTAVDVAEEAAAPPALRPAEIR